MTLVKTLLHNVAHSRSGDKGNRSNISVIAFRADVYPYLLKQITEDKVKALFSHKGATKVTRYELPHMSAMNFVIDDVLEGGVNDGLGLDGHGKTLSFLLLGGIEVELPAELV